ncbi:MAG: C4-dicarboxylate ABC transporter, partial [Pseudomonadota bacterium]
MKLLRWMGLALATCCAAELSAAEITLKVHHFLSEKAPLHREFLVRWETALEEAANGRIDVQLFAGMSLGGKPGDLFDQAVLGTADIVLTVPGYTPGRFKRSEVFELPF